MADLSQDDKEKIKAGEIRISKIKEEIELENKLKTIKSAEAKKEIEQLEKSKKLIIEKFRKGGESVLGVEKELLKLETRIRRINAVSKSSLGFFGRMGEEAKSKLDFSEFLQPEKLVGLFTKAFSFLLDQLDFARQTEGIALVMAHQFRKGGTESASEFSKGILKGMTEYDPKIISTSLIPVAEKKAVVQQATNLGIDVGGAYSTEVGRASSRFATLSRAFDIPISSITKTWFEASQSVDKNAAVSSKRIFGLAAAFVEAGGSVQTTFPLIQQFAGQLSYISGLGQDAANIFGKLMKTGVGMQVSAMATEQMGEAIAGMDMSKIAGLEKLAHPTAGGSEIIEKTVAALLPPGLNPEELKKLGISGKQESLGTTLINAFKNVSKNLIGEKSSPAFKTLAQIQFLQQQFGISARMSAALVPAFNAAQETTGKSAKEQKEASDKLNKQINDMVTAGVTPAEAAVNAAINTIENVISKYVPNIAAGVENIYDALPAWLKRNKTAPTNYVETPYVKYRKQEMLAKLNKEPIIDPGAEAFLTPSNPVLHPVLHALNKIAKHTDETANALKKKNINQKTSI